MVWLTEVPELEDLPENITPPSPTSDNKFILELENKHILLIAQLLHIYKLNGPKWMAEYTDEVLAEFMIQTSIVSKNAGNHYVFPSNLIQTTLTKQVHVIDKKVWHSPMVTEKKAAE